MKSSNDMMICAIKCLDCNKKLRISSTQFHKKSKGHIENDRGLGYSSPMLMTQAEYDELDKPDLESQQKTEERLIQARREYSMKYYNANRETIAERCKNRYSEETVHCEHCNKTIGKRFWDKHVQLKTHVRNKRLAELEKIVSEIQITE